MKKIILIALLSVITIYGQNLNNEWQEIDSLYQAQDFDKVKKLMPNFISNLKNVGLNEKLAIPYLYLGTIENIRQNINSSDSLMKLSYNYSTKYRNSTLCKQIQKNRIENIRDFVVNHSELEFKEKYNFLTKIELLAVTEDLIENLIEIKYLKAKLLSKTNNKPDAIAKLEEAHNLLIKVNNPNLQTIVNSKLFDLYISTSQNAKAFNILNTNNTTQKLHVIFKYSSELSKNGEFASANGLLKLIRDEIIESNDIHLITDYLKNRAKYYIALNEHEKGLEEIEKFIYDYYNRYSLKAQIELEMLLVQYSIEIGDVNIEKRLIDLSKLFEDNTIDKKYFYKFQHIQGNLFYKEARYKEAINNYTEVLGQDNLLKNEEKSVILNSLGLSYLTLGDYDNSLRIFNELSEFCKSTNQDIILISSELNKGILSIQQEKFQKAISNFQYALAIAKRINNEEFIITSKSRIAETYSAMGIEKTADKIQKELEAYSQKVRRPGTKIALYRTFARSYKNSRSFEKAKSYLQSALIIANENNIKNSQILIYNELAELSISMNNYAEAIEYFSLVYPFIIKRNKDEDFISINFQIAQSYNNISSYDSAIVYLNKSLKRNQSSTQLGYIEKNNFNTIGTALGCYFNFSRGAKENNIDLIYKAFEKINKEVNKKKKIFVPYETATVSNSLFTYDIYNTLIDIAAYLYTKTNNFTYLEKAFNTAEFLRSKNFVSDIGTKVIDKLNLPEQKQIEVLNSNTKSSNGNILATNMVTIDNTSTNNSRGFSISKGKKEVEKIKEDYEEIKTLLEGKEQRYLDLVSVNTLNLNSIKDYLDDNQTILNYFVNEANTYLFVVNKKGETFFNLNLNQTQISNLVEIYRNNIQNYKSDAYKNISEKLYTLLIAPAEKYIKGKDLIIIPSKSLHNLPFTSLMNNSIFLIEKHGISFLPNASAIQFVQTQKDRKIQNVLALGNPTNTFTTPLPGAEYEVYKIKSIFNNSEIFVKDEAKETFIKENTMNFDVIHFACHGLFNYDLPLLSSLALAPDSQNDGRLELHEIFNLDLSNNSLVVLSACETGLSQIKKNDDMIGLVRGFLFAGSPSIIASLWKVSDNGTQNLMNYFYENLSIGFKKSKALQRAQTRMINERTYSHPFFWSAFTLNGSEK